MIIPVFGTGTIPATKEFLQKLGEVTERTGVIPDIATSGKIIGGGLPVGAGGCSKEVIENVLEAEMSLTVAGTFGGNPMTLAAGTAMLRHLHANPQIYENLTRKGDWLRKRFNEWAKTKGYPAFMTGDASMF